MQLQRSCGGEGCAEVAHIHKKKAKVCPKDLEAARLVEASRDTIGRAR